MSDSAPRGHALRRRLASRRGWVGDFDYARLCLPRLPGVATEARGVFFALDDHMPIAVGCLMGLQHCLAMIGGIISVPRILAGAGPGHLNLDPDVQAYLISTAVFISGLMSVLQIVRVRLGRGYYFGTGLISMSGISFTFLPVAEAAFSAMYADGFCATAPEGPLACPDAYGRWLGTVMVGALAEVALSFIPPRVLRRAFPPIVTGATVFLIGAELVAVGLKYWAGGAGPCYDYARIQHLGGTPSDAAAIFADCPNIFGPGDRHYPWGNPRWIGLGFFVFSIIVVVEVFGSPFMRNSQVVIGLVSGVILSAVLGYIDKDLIAAAPVITFPWVKTFKLGFYAPAILPVLIAHTVSAVESIGDITATCDVSRVATEGEEFESRIQGGLLADGVNSFIAALMTSSPTTTFSQNNGVIAATSTANRSAGLWACAWLMLMGLIGKIGGVFVAIPDAVLGGMTTFLFAAVAVSGIRILGGLKWDRRDRFILAISLSVGLGVVAVPTAFQSFMPVADNMIAESVRQGVVIVLTTGYSVGGILALVLNLVIPNEPEPYFASQMEMKNSAESDAADAESGEDVVESDAVHESDANAE